MKRRNELKVHVSILLTKDYTRWEKYDKSTMKSHGYNYSDFVKREQKFLKNLIKNKYKDTVEDPRLVVLVYIHSNFGQRKSEHYKVVLKYSPAYYLFMNTDDYSEEASFNDLKHNL